MDSKRKTLLDLYNQCTEGEQKLFNRMYKNVDEIPEDKIDWATQQCLSTLKLPHHLSRIEIEKRNSKIDNLLK